MTINLLLGQNGIITRAQGAGKAYNAAAFKEQVEMDIQDVLMGLYLDGETNISPTDPDFIERMEEKGYDVTDNGDGSITLEKDGGIAIVHPDWTIEVEGVPIYNQGEPGDTIPPTATVSYSTTAPTNGTVLATMETSEKIVEPNGWITVDDTHYTREYTINVTDEVIEITDLAGNIGQVMISISNIDTTAPNGMASYSPSTLTGGTVRVTITTNKEIQTPSDWTRQDTTHYYKDYTANTTETITITDLASNTGSVEIKVTNILTGATVENPIVTGGLTPVKWDGSNWVNTTTSDNQWYDYIAQSTGTASGGTSRWANAKTSNGSFLVWIPRYEYKITDGYHGYQGTSGNGTLLASGAAGTIDVNFIPLAQTTASDGYTIHPAFTNSGNNGLGELSGMWIGKFESSSVNNSNGTSGDKVKIVPDVRAWTDIKISVMFNKAQDFVGNNGMIGYDSHMMKNTEWGAVVYLAHSRYGRNGTKVTRNNSSNYYTGRAAASVSDTTHQTNGAYTYSQTQGQLASTTGNIYGIYDMSGGAWEYVMGVLNNSKGASGFSSLPDEKYYDNYTDYSNIKKGDAIYETSSSVGTGSSSYTSWFNEASNMVYSSAPWFGRGGFSLNYQVAGIFSFSDTYNSGYSGGADTLFGFRIVVCK